MEKQKLIYVESKAQFSPSSVSNKAIVFIKDTKEIWTHGTYFICSNVWATPITLTLSGDSTGSVSIDGSGNVTLQVTNNFLTGTDGITDANNAVQVTYNKVSYYPHILYGSTNLFPASYNANAILTLNTHDYTYNHQLGFSSNKGIYHRTRAAGKWDASWEKLLTSTNYTNYPHTFASLTNKPTTISGYGITDSIPIIKGGEVTTDTDLSTLGMTTKGAKLSVSCCGDAGTPSWLHPYSNFLMFRSTHDSYSGIATDVFNHCVTFIGGRNLETTANNVPNWWFKIKGNSGTTYDLNSFQNVVNNLGNYVTINTDQAITSYKIFKATAPADDRETVYYNIGLKLTSFGDNHKKVAAIGMGNEPQKWYKAAIGFERTGTYDRGDIVLLFNNISDQTTCAYSDIKVRINAAGNISTIGTASASGFKKTDSSDSYVLLGGGGHKLLSDLSSAHTHDWSSITSKPSLLGAMAVPLFYPYANDSKLGAYISTINNRFYSADLRYTVTTTNLRGDKHSLFDDNYDGRMQMDPGTTATITIEGYNFVYNNGYIMLYFYLYNAYPLKFPKSITAKATNQSGTEYTLNRATYVESGNTIAFSIGLEYLTKLEFTIVSQDDAYCGITNIDYFSRRTENTVRDCAVVTKYNANTLYHNLTAPKYIVKNGTSSQFLKADGSLDNTAYLPLSGGTMTGALNFANNTWNLVGDDVYIGDCNVGGMLGIKGSNADTPGFAMYNSAGTLLGKLYASGTSLYWSNAKILTASGTSKQFVMGDGSLYSDTVSYTTWDKTTTSGIAWFPIAQITDFDQGTALFMVRGYAHSSIIFTVTKGYDNGNINVLAGGGSFNGSYAYIKGVRQVGTAVEIGLNASATLVQITIKVIQPTFTYSLRPSLVESTSTTTPYVQYDINSGSNHNFGIISSKFTGNLIGNADTASNISTVNPILAQPFEKNTIQVVSNPQGALAEQQGTAASITHALRFNWYNTAYEIGNVRGGASNSLGFGITYGNNNLCLLVKTNGTYSPYGFIGDLTGNAASANKWAIARTITLTGDVTGSVTLDGSSNVTLTTATAGSGTSTFLKCPDKRNSYPAEVVTSGQNIGASFMTASKLGISGDGSYYDALIIRGYGDHTGGNENAIMFGKNTSSVYHSQYAFGSTTTWGTLYKFLDSGNYKNYAPSLSGEGATGTWGINISGTANKVANALTLQLNGGTTSGTNKFVYDGSAAYTVNITPASIGAAASSHNHDTAYLKLSGGTLGSSSQSETNLYTQSSTAKLRLLSYSDSTNYIQSGNSEFTGNATLKITGYNNVTGTNLYLKFNNIYCRDNDYINIDSGNYNSYALPLSGGTLTGTLISRDIRPSANLSYSLGTSSYYYNYVYANYFKKNGSSDSYVLLGGGGHKAVSDFAPNNVATLSSSGMGNSDQWTLVFEKSYPANYWYAPTTMFYIRSGTAGCGILCFYNYWASGTQLDDYEREVWFFGAQKSETGITFGGANRDINDFFRIYIDKANFKYCIYYNRYNNQSLQIQELQFFTVPEPGEYLSTGSLRSSFFTNSNTVVDLPTESSTLVRVPIKTTYNHDRTIKTTKSIYASSFYENSDIRLKENVRGIDQSDLTKQVDLVQFNFKDGGTKKYGVIAQQLEQVGLQNLVYENNGNKAVDYISLLVLEIQRLRNEIGELKQEINKKN